MHKIQPVREYTLYGPGNQKAHVDVESTLPKIKPPKDIEISQAMRDEIMANRERLRESQVALAHSQPQPVTSPTFSRSGSQPQYPRYQRNQAFSPDLRTRAQ
ncbi:unnamed protein product [Allacma fusca]|uniref:Uncharacterized protein n=1 Tax=Allacma fusca TaxID=39272 RepID=A0A8J2Q1P1_9HEXA|nr:unnamed protein product [Allacma fusca]